MALLNYTTKIDADRTAQEISKELSSHGAKAVMTEYDGESGILSSISFKIRVGERDMGFRLPCDWRPVLKILENDSKVPRSHKDKFQAIRTSWRIVKDWVEAQMALVETKMVTTEQVFMPYIVTKDGRTLAEKMTENPSFLLGDGNKQI